MQESERERLAGWLTTNLPARSGPVRLLRVERLTSGAIQENWLVHVEMEGTVRTFVLRRGGAAGTAASISPETELRILSAAHTAGVAVPKPVAMCADPGVLGRPFTLIGKVEGVAFGPRIVRDLGLAPEREGLAHQLGRELARIHRLTPRTAPPDLRALLGPAPTDVAESAVANLRRTLDRLGAVRPALEWGLRWAEVTAPGPSPTGAPVTLVHGDFRTGHYMVDAHGLTAVLDWESAGWGDPLSDLGSFCAECWRFSRPDLEAGGIGSRAAFYRGYEEESGLEVDDARVRWWEVVAHLKGAVIALEQGTRHRSGAEPSLELALTGRIAAELELAVVRSTAPIRWQETRLAAA
jgi:aminoglycoside phosphotransferase (APT) family kinase protein